MPPQILSWKSSKPGPPVAALNAHCQGQGRSGRPSCSAAGAWLVGHGRVEGLARTSLGSRLSNLGTVCSGKFSMLFP